MILQLQIGLIVSSDFLAAERVCRVLLPQLGVDCCLIIINDSVCPSLTLMLSAEILASPYLEIIENEKCIGLDACALRLLEYAKAEWIWLLRDLDYPRSTAVQELQSIIFEINADVGLIKLAEPANPVDRDFFIRKEYFPRESFQNKFLNNLMLISTSVFRRQSLTNLQLAYRSISTRASQIIVILDLLKNNYSILVPAMQVFESVALHEKSGLEFEAAFMRAKLFIDSYFNMVDYRNIDKLLSSHSASKPQRLLKDAYELEQAKGREYAWFVYSEVFWARLMSENKFGLVAKMHDLFCFLSWRLKPLIKVANGDLEDLNR